jgi:hypothetical protein
MISGALSLMLLGACSSVLSALLAPERIHIALTNHAIVTIIAIVTILGTSLPDMAIMI